MEKSYFSPGMVDEIIDECRRLLENKEDYRLRAILGNTFLYKKNFAQGVVELKKALAGDPTDSRNMLQLALAYKGMGLFNEAMDLLDQVLAINSDWADASKHIGDIYKEMGLQDKALEAYQRALDINPHYVEAGFYLGCLLEQMGMSLEATAIFKGIIQENILLSEDELNLARAHRDIAVLYGEKQLVQEAINHMKRAITLHPEWPDTHYNLGMAYNSLGNYKEAMYYFKRALELNPKYEKARDAYWECGQKLE